MVKTVFNLTPGLTADLGKHPEAPPLPHYDPEVEKPKWDWFRWWWGLPQPERHPDIPRVGGNPDSDDKPDWRGVIKANTTVWPEVKPYAAHEVGLADDPRYHWFDTPDYADPFKKLGYASYRCAVFASLAQALAGVLENQPFNWPAQRSLFVRYTLPFYMGAMVTSFTVVTVANLRGNKDDRWNYVIGGLVAGCATGRKDYLSHFRHTLFWVTIATYLKHNAETNGVLVPRVRSNLRNLGLTGNHAEGGITTGNLHLIKGSTGDPGRDVRRFAM